MITARPRRSSEQNNAPTQIIPIPPASSFIIFSETNRFEDKMRELSPYLKQKQNDRHLSDRRNRHV